MVQESSYTGQRGKTSIAVTTLYTKSSFLSTKKSGNKGSLIDTDQSWLSLTPPTRPPSMRCHCFSSVSTQTSAIKLRQSSFAKTKMRSRLLKHCRSLKAGMSSGPLRFLWSISQRQRSTPLKMNFRLPACICDFHRNQAWT